MAIITLVFTPMPQSGAHGVVVTQPGEATVDEQWTEGTAPPPVNQPPMVIGTIPDLVAPVGTTVTYNLKQHVTDPENDVLTFSGVAPSGAQVGSATLTAAGVLSFSAPASAATGAWTFNVSDTAGNVVAGTIGVIAAQVQTGSSIAADIFPDRTIRIAKGSFGTNVDRVEPGVQPSRGYCTATPTGSHLVICLAKDSQKAATGSYTVAVRVIRTSGVIENWTVNVSVKPRDIAFLWKPEWAPHNHYRFDQDASGRSIITPHKDSRAIYLSSSSGYTATAIANEVGGGMTAAGVTTAWLEGQSTYGTQAKPLAAALAFPLFEKIFKDGKAPWLFVEKGGPGIDTGATYLLDSAGIKGGPSDIHPAVMTSYGTGAITEISQSIRLMRNAGRLAVLDADFRFIRTGDRANPSIGARLLLEGITTSGHNPTIEYMDYTTIRRCRLLDTWDSTQGGWNTADQGKGRTKGIYLRRSQHLLVEDCLLDWHGFAPGYAWDGSTGQIPLMRSHAFYLDGNDGSFTAGTTIRNCMGSRSEGVNLQIRGGGRVQGLLLLDANVGGFIAEGDEAYYGSGEDILVLSAGLRTSQRMIDSTNILGTGWEIKGPYCVLDRVLVAHGFGPNNEDWPGMSGGITGVPAAYNTKSEVYAYAANSRKGAIKNETTYPAVFTRNILFYKWDGPSGGTSSSIPASTARDNSTPMKYADAKRSVSNSTLKDFFDWIRGRSAPWVDFIDFRKFVQEPFGFWVSDKRTAAATLHFVPHPDTDGRCWDNPKCWFEDVGWGPQNGDSVVLGRGFSECNLSLSLAAVDLRNGAKLLVTAGALKTSVLLGSIGATVTVLTGGQFRFAGYVDTSRISLSVLSGGSANTAAVTRNLSATVSGDAEMVLGYGGGTSWKIGAAETLTIVGSNCLVGWDGVGGTFSLTGDAGAKLAFTFDDSGVAPIKRFRSGIGGFTAPTTQGSVNLAGIHLVLNNLGAWEGTQTLIEATALSGDFASVSTPAIPAEKTAVVSKVGNTISLTVS